MMKATGRIIIALNNTVSGDKDNRLRAIWDQYRKRLLYYITGIMYCDKEDGEDILQEIMIKVYDNLDHYKTGTSFNAWIYAITRNHCLDTLRKKRTRPRFEELGERSGTALDVFDDVCSKELHRAIRASLENLSDEDREMIYLRHFEGLRYKSIGNIIGMNVNSVKTRMRAAEARLRQDLKEWL